MHIVEMAGISVRGGEKLLEDLGESSWRQGFALDWIISGSGGKSYS